MIWQIRQALPWTRIENPILRATFQYANQKAVLYGQRWSADESKKLYSMLKKHVFEELNDLDTKFTLVHVVWTTKGNRFAFIRAAVAYIDTKWQYVVRHLTLKMIPWRHVGHLLARPIATVLKKDNLFSKISLCSNNNTMASTMYDLLHESNKATHGDESAESGWDPTCMHIQCFCHKLALIVNAGLKALSLQTLPPGKVKRSVLGFFPVLGKVTKEEEERDTNTQPSKVNEEPVPHLDDYEAGTESDYGNADKERSEEEEDDETLSDSKEPNTGTNRSTQNKHFKSTKLLQLTQKLDEIIKQITRSAAQRSYFEKTADNLRLKVAPLIAGYGIRWNIRYQSYQKAINARVVIDHIIKGDQENHSSGVFANVHFSPRDWEEVDNLNAELEVFVKLTSQMEGDSATCTHVIPKYLELKENLTGKIESSEESELLYPMYHAMLKRVNKYLDEAMRCDTLILATILHPCYRMHLFELGFGVDSTEVKDSLKLLRRVYRYTEMQEKKKASLKTPIDPDVGVIEKPVKPPTAGNSLMSRLASRMKVQPTAEANEIEAYLKADLLFKDDAIDHKTTPLLWWKVHKHSLRIIFDNQANFFCCN
ncbi:hypothetical protein PSTG_05738 [Puccinia striiformis f. sp. tritici PST-78]|uniref:HAT C-terminal dimerisation domain-containing protein n=1 Tax=Puccinia striiformis f. sp. tritici PST-78 TaxID=1165861 RepID=A0A0L0VPA6_9BASI|nr:hypothetical protein PSTG_05738 [Puccinia striiformis f. sp. tritici PST-78]